MSFQNVHKSQDENAVLHASKRVAVVFAAKNCFWRNLEHWLSFNSSQCFFNRKKRLNELHVDGLLGGGKERVEWVSEERREKEGGGVRIKKCCQL